MTNFNCAWPDIQRGRDLAFCLKVPLDSLLVWASSRGSGETARMRRLAWTFAARISDKYQIHYTRPNWSSGPVAIKPYVQSLMFYVWNTKNLLMVSVLNSFLWDRFFNYVIFVQISEHWRNMNKQSIEILCPTNKKFIETGLWFILQLGLILNSFPNFLGHITPFIRVMESVSNFSTSCSHRPSQLLFYRTSWFWL